MLASLVLANGNGRFNTGTQPASICAAGLVLADNAQERLG
jgi:hypothetical protein